MASWCAYLLSLLAMLGLDSGILPLVASIVAVVSLLAPAYFGLFRVAQEKTNVRSNRERLSVIRQLRAVLLVSALLVIPGAYFQLWVGVGFLAFVMSIAIIGLRANRPRTRGQLT
jgi:uncharacterized membrane protein